ncbi:GspE family protein, partial [Bacillus safensis]
RNIITLEDPVETRNEEVLQVQVNEKAGITYAAGLRAILRHDPDVIVLGEIRDAETARTAIRAALTGHLVLSTLHAKNAKG